MSYLETMRFIGKCLTLSHDKKHNLEILNILKNENINWDSVVKVSTSHFVFPALYHNLKSCNFLFYLPKDLVNFMKFIDNKNHERNLEIIRQVKDINNLLLENNIKPIFLKGVSFLIENLYNNISERMIGDIDFLVDKVDFPRTIKVLKNYGYRSKVEEKHIVFPAIHYPKMVKKGFIAAIEVHKDVILNNYSKHYTYTFFLNEIRKFDNIYIPSIKNQIIHNCINKQFSDKGKCYKSFTIRNSYDLLKLSAKENTLEVINNNKFNFNLFNIYIGASNLIFDVDSLVHKKNINTTFNLSLILFLSKNLILLKINKKKCDYIRNSIIIVKKIIKLSYKKDYRNYFIDRLNKKVYKKIK